MLVVHRSLATALLSAALVSGGPPIAAQQSSDASVATGQPATAAAQPAIPPATTPHAVAAEDGALARAQLADRVVGLLSELAVRSRQIGEPDLRLSCQLEVAALLWSREPEQARQIYRDAFDALVQPSFASADEKLNAAKRISTLLAEVARHDPALAEGFSQRMAVLMAPDDTSPENTPASARGEMLSNAALEMLPGDPERAAALGSLALADGLTPSLTRLLIVLRGVDAPRADALFSAALATVLQRPNPDLTDVGALAFYLVAIGGSRPDGVPVDAMRAYLDVALRLIAQTSSDAAEASSAYFIGRQLSTFYVKYLPERSPELEARVALLSQSDGLLRAERAASARSAGSDAPDAVHARAATTALERDDYSAARAEAAAIEDDSLRARIHAQAVLRLLRMRRFDEATGEIARVPDPARRASLLVQLASAAHARGDLVRAVQALADAQREALRAPAASQRIQALFSVASAFAEVDPPRAFSALRDAVESVNRAARAEDKAVPLSKVPPPRSLNFNATFAQLARIDFDGALLLAQRFDARPVRLLAELAVCRGGLVAAGDSPASSDDEDALQ
jgi:hypothetical protein